MNKVASCRRRSALPTEALTRSSRNPFTSLLLVLDPGDSCWCSSCCCFEFAHPSRRRSRFWASAPAVEPPASFWGLLITGTTFNISSFMGLIMVVGIVAKNRHPAYSTRIRNSGREERQLLDAMIQAGERRLRPILMTALATMAGMIPLALRAWRGSQMLQPLAIAVIGGVLASIVLSLIITPAVHYLLTRSDQRVAR